MGAHFWTIRSWKLFTFGEFNSPAYAHGLRHRCSMQLRATSWKAKMFFTPTRLSDIDFGRYNRLLGYVDSVHCRCRPLQRSSLFEQSYRPNTCPDILDIFYTLKTRQYFYFWFKSYYHRLQPRLSQRYSNYGDFSTSGLFSPYKTTNTPAKFRVHVTIF